MKNFVPAPHMNELAEPSPAFHSVSTDPLVSVVIPCYNQARFLGEAIESILSQTYSKVELIVVNDGSNDNTAEVAAHYPQVHYMQQENQGLAAARNTGLHRSRGEYLVFLDADDRLLPNALEVGVNQLMASPDCAFVSGRFRYIEEDGSVKREEIQEPAQQEAYASFLQGNYIGMHATVMYRRDVLEAEGGFNPSLPACEDYELYLRIARKYPVSRHRALVAEYRQHNQNMSNDAELMLKTVLSVLHSQWQYVKADNRYREAYKAGLRSWQEHYSSQLFVLVSSSWSSGDFRRGLHLMRTWIRYAPREYARYVIWLAKETPARAARAFLFSPLSRALTRRRSLSPHIPVGQVNFGDFRSLIPISREFGFDRGLPIDRYYIENFLKAEADRIQGRVLEIGDDTYTRQYGGSWVTFCDVLHITPGNPRATIVADLAHADHIPSNAFDCIVLTQTLHLIYDVKSAVQTIFRILKPGGVVLATFPGISQISIDEWANTWYWAFTVRAARRIFAEAFPIDHIELKTYGNVLAATAFLNGLAAQELNQEELDFHDPNYAMLITVRAEKPVLLETE